MAILVMAPLYLAINFWLLTRMFILLRLINEELNKKPYKIAIGIIYFIVCLTPVFGVLLPNGAAKEYFTNIGNYWIGINLYLFVIGGGITLFRFIYRKIKKIPKTNFSKTHNLVTFLSAFVVLAIIICIGIITARNIETTNYNVSVDKNGGKVKTLNAVLIADLHLGYNIGVEHMGQMAKKINDCKPDIVFIAGDIFDNNFGAINEPEKISEIFKSIKTKYGIYACYGNHDIAEKILAGFTFDIAGKKYDSDTNMDKFLKDSNIKLLRDESVLIDDSFYVYGRKDYKQVEKNGSTRKTADQLMENIDKSKPVIVIDHEPREQEELAKAGVDVDLCGHTHDGQVFPASVLTKLIWTNSYGMQRFGNMTNIVTSGVGLYGPNMRIGTFPEVCNIKIDFRK